MIWQNLYALAGLSLLAIPILIHMLSRKRAVLQKFPSLQFLNVTRLLPTRSPNLTDIPLLLVRLAIFALAVLALAQPLVISAARRQSLNASLARVIVVDTSRSMQRIMPNGKTAVDSARALAVALTTDAPTSTVLQTVSPSRVLPGAAAWLNAQGGRGEVVLLSDFQSGSIDSAAFAIVPARYGVRPIRLGSAQAINAAVALRAARTIVTAVADTAQISAEWTAVNGSASPVVLLSTSADRPEVLAAQDAANAVTSPAEADSTMPVAIVFPGAAETATVLQSAKAPGAAWMAQALMAVRENGMLVSAAAGEAVNDTSIAAPFAVVASNENGQPVVYAAAATVNGISRLTFFQRSSASALSSAALIAAVAASVGVASDFPESEPLALSDEALSKFSRSTQEVGGVNAAADQRATARSGMSDGRWLWMLVLALLGVETLMRRKSQNTGPLEPA